MIRRVGPYFRRLCIRVVIISGSALPTIENARYSNEKRLTNRTWSFRVADDWMKATSNLIKNLLQWEHLIVDSPVTSKNKKNDFLLIAPLESCNSDLAVYLIQNGERKRTVIQDIGR